MFFITMCLLLSTLGAWARPVSGEAGTPGVTGAPEVRTAVAKIDLVG